MNRQAFLLVLMALTAVAAAACETIAPPPPPTAPPSPTPTPEPTATITPTPGPREFIDAAYCWPSPVDQGSFSLMRFFADGVVLDAGVGPFGSCREAWEKMGGYLTPESVDTFNHGEYLLSGEAIRFELAQARTERVIGEVTGRYLGDRMILTRGGADELEYVLVAAEP